LPAPYNLYKKGGAIRKKCRYAAEAKKLLEQRLQAGKSNNEKMSRVDPPTTAMISPKAFQSISSKVVRMPSYNASKGSLPECICFTER
jgi:hypothetical protein